MKLRAGAATSNITPALGCFIAGSMTQHIATEVHDELQVRSVVLDDGKTQIAIALCDLCVLPRAPIAAAKHLIHGYTGIPMPNILVAATHTHSGPATAHLFQALPDPDYVQWLSVRIADCVRIAFGRRQPARIGWGVGHEEKLVFNRRHYLKGPVPADPFGRTTDRVLMNPGAGNPDVVRAAGPVDPEVGVLAVESTDGRPIAVLASYALHYIGGVGAGHISADYFGAWANAMIKQAGTTFVPILANACSGNINAIDVRSRPAAANPYSKMQDAADALAAECYRTWRSVKFQDEVALAASEEDVPLAIRKPGPEDVAAARKLLAQVPGTEPLRDRAQIYARETVILHESWPNKVSTPVQALKIGGLGIATMPGEAFVELGMEVKAKSPFRPTFLIELANDYQGYIPTVEGHEQGGYETWRAKSSCLEKEAAPKLVAAALRRLRALA